MFGFQFQRPRLAMIALLITIMCFVFVVYPDPTIEKFAFGLAIGYALGFFGIAAKGILNRNSNLSVFLVICSIVLLVASILGTPDWVHAANSLESMVGLIVSGGMSLFSQVEEG